MMRLPAPTICLIIAICTAVLANVEKVIFLGPSSLTLPDAGPSLEDLCLEELSPSRSVVSTKLPVQFPTDADPHGTQHWYLLRGLQESARYEVRVCWVATQPTQFWLETYEITDVFETPDLISALATYSQARQESCAGKVVDNPRPGGHPSSTLFLRIQSAADFYTTNKTLMKYPEPVDVDIILDPYLLNVLPRSLGPTAVYLTILLLVSIPIANFAYKFLNGITATHPHSD